MYYGDNMSDYFKFEDEKLDIPFYNEKPKLSKPEWLLLIIAELLFLTPIIFPIKMTSEVFSFYLCLVVLIPILYVSKGNLSLFFRKIKRENIKLIIICTILPFVYSMTMIFVLEWLKVPGYEIEPTPINLINIITMIVQLMGEELFKIILLILIMSLIYHFSKNRKLSIIISAIVTMITFGAVHSSYGPLIQILLVQGLGSIFDLYAYLKTKNVLVSYTAHLLFDFIPFGMEIIVLLMGIPLT